MPLSQSEEQLVEKHLLEDEEVIESHSSANEAFAVTGLRLLRLDMSGNKESVDSTLLRGSHVVGCSVVSERSYDDFVVAFAGLLAIGGLGMVALFQDAVGIAAALFFWVVAALIVYDASNENTAIQIQTTGESVDIEMPEEATVLGTTISRVIAENA